ncbi:MAG: triphosphoribosyl-dephospho-CoA synthase [Pirellulaceae bacterium]|nr:triphosphoribosyl-dephospho-CoA synthase [Pirellulaceae bacterium]
MSPLDQAWPVGQAVRLACALEATAPKVGNVHPQASFADMHWGHFIASTQAIGPTFDAAGQLSVGQMVLGAASVTRQRVGCNTNLGTLLLLAPLASATARLRDQPAALTLDALRQSVASVLEELTPADSRDVYAAIAVAQPGGLGQVDSHDVQGPAPSDLRSAMQQVSGVDAVARQYVTNMEDIFERLLPWLREELSQAYDPLQAIVRLQIRWLASEPDGLIVRKLGMDHAQSIQQQAAAVWHIIQSLPTTSAQPLNLHPAVCELDRGLRADGNRRNPGTTADLIAATLFCQLVCSQ